MKFGIVTSIDDREIKGHVKSIMEILKSRNHKYILETKSYDYLKMNVPNAQVEDMHADMILAIGNDSTILKTFGKMKTVSLPVLGVSANDTSFLAECSTKQFAQVLKKIEKKNYFVDKRMRLQVEVDGKILPFALNELTISALRGATLVRYTLKVNKELIWRDSADGVIISTPTGSTGYALSAGGPIASSDTEIFVITPIASINHNKPFVVSNSSIIEISEIFSSVGCEAIIDGRIRERLDKNKVRITISKLPAKFVRLEERSHANIFKKLKRRAEIGNIPKDAPPSAKFIYKILQYEGSLTQKEIISLSMLPPRTVRSAIKYLVKNDLVASQTSVRDTRQSIYFVS